MEDSENRLDECTVGTHTKTECHSTRFSIHMALNNLDELSKDDLCLLHYRIKDFKRTNGTICNFHKCRYLSYYLLLVYKCCDPFNKHKKIIETDLRIISIKTSRIFSEMFHKKLVPGDKLCRNCEFIIKSNLCENTTIVAAENKEQEILQGNDDLPAEGIVTHPNEPISAPESQQSTRNVEVNSSGSNYQSESQELQLFDNILKEFNIPNLKPQKLSKDRLAKKAETLIYTLLPKLGEKFSKFYDIEMPQFTNTITENIGQDSFALKNIIASLQIRFQHLKTISEKIQLLSLLPTEWKFAQIQKYFECTYYMCRQSNELKDIHGI